MTGESKVVEKKKDRIKVLLQNKTRLMLTISKLNEEINHLNSKLEGKMKFICMLNSRTENLVEILCVDKLSKYKKRRNKIY